MEILFSNSEIIEIKENASVNLDAYLDCVVISGQTNEKTILTISKNNQLIFVEGNSHTGFSHLRDRHCKLSFKNYWITTENKNIKLDNPSKFHPHMLPIIDFVKIADTIFTDENKNIEKNKKPELFDMYTGDYDFAQGKEKYHLLTYKDTKIVHTLFPDKKKHNEKKGCKFGKGFVTTNFKFPEGHYDLIVPYENEKGIVAYSILVRKFYSEQIERIFIQKHDIKGEPIKIYLLGFRNFNNFEKFEREDMNEFQCGDLIEFENIIDQIDKQNSF